MLVFYIKHTPPLYFGFYFYSKLIFFKQIPLLFMDRVHGHLKHRNNCAAPPGKYFLRVTLLITIQGWGWRRARAVGQEITLAAWGDSSEEGHWVPPTCVPPLLVPHCFLRTSGFPPPLPWAEGGQGKIGLRTAVSWDQGVASPSALRAQVSPNWPFVASSPRCGRWRESFPAGTPRVQAP